MTRSAALLIAAAAFAVQFAVLVNVAPAQMQARTQCGPYPRMIAMLATRYLEAPKAIGTVNRDHLMEVYVSAAGSWTILVTSADGNSCIIAAGGDWDDVPFKPGARS